MSMPSRIVLSALVTAAVALPLHNAHAQQAWVGPASSLSAALDYTYAPSDRVIEDEPLAETGDDIISNHSVALSAEYTPIERLGLQATVPIVTTRWQIPEGGGSAPGTFAPHGRYDDGKYHTVLQDFRFVGRYMVLEEPVAISPHLGFSMPMTNYETVGFAGAGRGLKQLHLGASIGSFFVDGPLQNFYLHLSYEFSLVEGYETGFPETEEIGQNRSDLKALIGYFILDNLELNVGADMRIAHGGFRFEDFNPNQLGPREYFHDALLAEEFFLLGGGLSYEVIEGLRLNALFRLWLTGKQTRDANVFGGGLSWDIL